jgi:hypothetical protein
MQNPTNCNIILQKNMRATERGKVETPQGLPEAGVVVIESAFISTRGSCCSKQEIPARGVCFVKVFRFVFFMVRDPFQPALRNRARSPARGWQNYLGARKAKAVAFASAPCSPLPSARDNALSPGVL